MIFDHPLLRRLSLAPQPAHSARRLGLAKLVKLSLTTLSTLATLAIHTTGSSASARVCTEAHAHVTATVGQVLLEPTRCFVMLAPNSLIRYVPDPVCPLDADSIMHGEILVALENGVCPYRPGDVFQRRVTLNAQGFLIAN